MSHGAYRPDDVTWTSVGGSPDHHQVWLWRLRPGYQRRSRILLGEVRRRCQRGYAAREWRAFPEGGPVEFPPTFDNHLLALEYLKQRWESTGVRLE